MNGQLFLQFLSHSFADNDNKLDFDIERKRQTAKNKSNLSKLISLALNSLEDQEIYCEINQDINNNCLKILAEYPDILAYYINQTSTENELDNYLRKVGLEERVYSYHGESYHFFQELKNLESEDKIGLCYFNKPADYRSLLKGLMSLKDFLADEAFIIISNVNEAPILDAIEDFKSFHNSKQVHQLLTATKENSTALRLEEEIIILLWQNNTNKLIAKRINQQGQSRLLQASQTEKKLLLHVGCGRYREDALPEDFRSLEWTEIRLDIDPRVQPDIIGTITDLSGVPNNTVDAVYSSHNLEHIYNFEVPTALAEFKRVLKPNGFVMFVVPDMQTAAEWVVRGEMEEPPLYNSPAGDVPALWMFYGMGTTYPGMPYMAHKTGFTINNLRQKLLDAGFSQLQLIRRDFDIVAYGYKLTDQFYVNKIQK